jgi:RIO kinase 1
VKDYLDDLEEIEYAIPVKQRARPKPERRLKRSHSQLKAEMVEQGPRPHKGVKPRPSEDEVFVELVEEDGARKGFTPSFASMSSPKNHLSNHEREWILTYLGSFYEDHLITDVLKRVKGGKEATVYCCRADRATGLSLVAGKVYHPRMFRSLKNDALYRQGRAVLDDQGKGVRGRREALAMAKKTRFGQDLRQLSWLTSEFETLRRLHVAGADVPRPIAQGDNAMLMEYIGEQEWPAPTLIHVNLQREEARRLFDRMVHNMELMLEQDLVHADLSAYNVLYWEGDIKIIDFPQAVDPFVNPDAFSLFARDVKRVCQYFARYGVATDPDALARDLWARHVPTRNEI